MWGTDAWFNTNMEIVCSGDCFKQSWEENTVLWTLTIVIQTTVLTFTCSYRYMSLTSGSWLKDASVMDSWPTRFNPRTDGWLDQNFLWPPSQLNRHFFCASLNMVVPKALFIGIILALATKSHIYSIWEMFTVFPVWRRESKPSAARSLFCFCFCISFCLLQMICLPKLVLGWTWRYSQGRQWYWEVQKAQMTMGLSVMIGNISLGTHLLCWR